MSLIKASAVKKQFRDAGFRVSKDTFPQLERAVSATLQKAIAAAEADRRKTIQASDVIA